MPLPLETILIILATGLVSGFINTVSAGGSFLTLPILILLGFPPHVANASNRIAIVCQSLTSSVVYYRRGLLLLKKSLYLTIPAVLGSLIGAYIAVKIDASLLEKSIGIFMIIAIFFMVFKPDRWINEMGALKSPTLTRWEFVAFVGIGIYGGFIQAGVGALLLTGMVLISHFDLKHANATKMLLSLMFNVSSVGIFLFNDLINWWVGLSLATSSMLGAYLGTHLSILGGSVFTRWAVIITLLLLAGQLLGIW